MINLKNILIVLLLLIISKNILLGIFTNNDELIIHGKISTYYTYTIKTYFKAQSSLPICYGFGSGILWGGSMFSKRTTRFLHEPKINGDKHTITIPLGYQGLNICDYKLERVSLDIPNDNDLVLFEKYVDLKYIGYAKTYANSNNRTSSVVPILKSKNKNNYTIDFYSHDDYDTYGNNLINIENLKEKKHKALSKKNYNTRKVLKLLHKVIISPYIHKYKAFPMESEIQNLWSKTNKMLYMEKSRRRKNIQKLQENITYANGYPIDEWGNHFQYKIIQATGRSNFNYVVLFSFGPDGVESKDDIYSNIRQGLPSIVGR